MNYKFYAIAVLYFLCSIGASCVVAQTFPGKPVRIVVPSTPGTGADIVARLLGQRLGDKWRQGVVIENQAGASGNIGMAAVAKAPPDGHTLVLAFLNHAINPSLFTKVPFDLLRDFKPIADIATVPLVIVANPSFSANSISDLITLAKSRPNPNAIFYGSAGTGSVLHLAFELLKSRGGFDLTHTPYKGTGPMLADILGNQIPLGAPAVAAALPLIKSGKVKALAVTSAKRSSNLPNVPTVGESGIEDYDVAAWEGLLAPANTPDSVIAKIYADVVEVAQNKDFVALLNAAGLELTLKNPAEFHAFLATELEKWSKIVKASGAKAD